MNKVLLVVSMLLLVTCAFAQRSTGVTDYLTVPTAKVLPVGDLSVAVNAVDTEVWGGDHNIGLVSEIGLYENLGLYLNTSLEDFDSDNIVGGVKWVVAPKDAESNGGQIALFANNLGKNRDEFYGASLTVDAREWFSYTITGLYNDDWEVGFGTTFSLNENVNLQAEYNSTNAEFVYGVGLTYKNLFGEVRYLDETDEFYASAGVNLSLW